MKTALQTITFSVILIALSACGLPEATSTPTPAPTATATLTPTNTSTATATSTPTATSTDTPSPTETISVSLLTLPTGKPAAAWQGLPVMPGAIAGDGDSSSYRFTIQASPEEVQSFYDQKLAQFGWNPFAAGQGETGAILLIYMKGTDMLTLSLIPQSKGLMFVLMVK